MSGTNPRVIRHNQPPGRGRVEMKIPVTSPNSQARNQRTQKRRAHEQARRGRGRGRGGRRGAPSLPTPTPRSVLPPRPSGQIHGTPGGSSRPSGAKPIGKVGKDYVHNLQQQIYFLEMETQF